MKKRQKNGKIDRKKNKGSHFARDLMSEEEKRAQDERREARRREKEPEKVGEEKGPEKGVASVFADAFGGPRVVVPGRVPAGGSVYNDLVDDDPDDDLVADEEGGGARVLSIPDEDADLDFEASEDDYNGHVPPWREEYTSTASFAALGRTSRLYSSGEEKEREEAGRPAHVEGSKGGLDRFCDCFCGRYAPALEWIRVAVRVKAGGDGADNAGPIAVLSYLTHLLRPSNDWVTWSPSRCGKFCAIGTWAAKRAARKLEEWQLIEFADASAVERPVDKAEYGPNAKAVRLVEEEVASVVTDNMKPREASRAKKRRKE
jgi:hypothetical protein